MTAERKRRLAGVPRGTHARPAETRAGRATRGLTARGSPGKAGKTCDRYDPCCSAMGLEADPRRPHSSSRREEGGGTCPQGFKGASPSRASRTFQQARPSSVLLSGHYTGVGATLPSSCRPKRPLPRGSSNRPANPTGLLKRAQVPLGCRGVSCFPIGNEQVRTFSSE